MIQWATGAAAGARDLCKGASTSDSWSCQALALLRRVYEIAFETYCIGQIQPTFSFLPIRS